VSKKRKSERRVNNSNTNKQLPLGPSYKPVPYSRMSDIEDRRRFHPDGELQPPRTLHWTRRYDHPYRSIAIALGLRYLRKKNFGAKKAAPHIYTLPRSAFRTVSQIADVNPVLGRFKKNRLKFTDPNTLICVRRKIRKEVLFAKKFFGKGGSGQRSPRFNYYSKVRCT